MCRGTRFTRDLHICATVLTEFSVGIVPFTAALGTALCRNDALPVLHGPFSRYDARWHGEYSIPSDHEEGRHGLAHVGLWCDITVPYRRYCNDRPVNAAGYAGETVLSSFYEIHHSADYDDHVNHCEIENHDFSANLTTQWHTYKKKKFRPPRKGELGSRRVAEHDVLAEVQSETPCKLHRGL